MKGVLFLLLLLVFCQEGFTQERSDKFHVIPQPVSLSPKKGNFHFNAETKIIFKNDNSRPVVDLFIKKINRSTGYHYSASEGKKADKDNSVYFRLNETKDTALGEEGYLLDVMPGRIVINANKPRGLFYAVQTLWQLMPPQIASDSLIAGIDWTVSCVRIKDYPRFKWRGLMLDVSRHFFPKSFVKKYIDEMAKYKYNVFHWHLTDDQGWRIEIKGLPKLTEVGAWRVPRTGPWRSIAGPERGEEATAGGFYTQEDVREIIEYARQRFVTVLPEIDVPGHSLALIAAYPELSCTGEEYPVYPKYSPDSLDNVLCVANDSTWMVLDKIFTQVAQLFPSEYIHVGGDEANRKFWTKDPEDIALMKREGLTSPAELQSYFEKKLEKMVLAKGKKMIGWDEILEGGLAPEATVMSWRGMKGGIKATKMGHHVIMSPYSHTYISQLQGDPLAEPEGPGRIRLQKCYETNILPEGVNPRLVLGGEACLWTEFVPNYRHVEYMTWPRALAASEVFWGTTGNWADFTRRVEKQLSYLDAAKVKYARSMFDPVISAVRKGNTLRVKLSTEAPGLKLYYTFDGTNPDNFYPEYQGELLAIPKGASEIRVVTYRDGRQIGKQINCPVDLLKRSVKNER